MVNSRSDWLSKRVFSVELHFADVSRKQKNAVSLESCDFEQFWGCYALHTDPLVRGKSCLSVSVSVCPFEDEMTRDISPRIGR